MSGFLLIINVISVWQKICAWGGRFFYNLLNIQEGEECVWGVPGPHCREGRARLIYWICKSHISSPAGLPSPAHRPTFSEPVKPQDPSVAVAVTSTWQCHPQRRLMSSPDAPCIQGQKSSASPCLMIKWSGVRTGRSIAPSAILTHQY